MKKKAEILLEVKNLSVRFGQAEERAVDNISFTVERGKTVALVGESGSGKSMAALSVMQLLPYPFASHEDRNGRKGKILFDGKNLMEAAEKDLQSIRGNRIGMIFQEPMTSFNPLHTIEKQISEVLILHKNMDKEAARKRTIELLKLVALPNPEKRLKAFPHELSGGQRQRVMIAMALANEPDLLIADEPTTALDVTIQAQILKLLMQLQKRFKMAILLITHDLGVVRNTADKVYVMKDGKIVEEALVKELFENPQKKYTKMLLTSEPSGQAYPLTENEKEILRVDNLNVKFPIRRGIFGRPKVFVHAVDNVSLYLREGETLGIVGESGSGKTTLGFAMLKLVKAEGNVVFLGKEVLSLKRKELLDMRKSMQIVFQDPFASLNPRMTAGDIIAEGLDINNMCKDKEDRVERIIKALYEVGLEENAVNRYPHEFSGGQRQRISIARAIILQPKFIVLDEPTSALDMTVQKQIIELLRDIQARHRISFAFISHDLKVIKALSHRVMVMKSGKVIEYGTMEKIFNSPKEKYTKELLEAALVMEN
ncbi:MAG: ABC transporter ATP-binding protein [Alphaproteobacteria bacterium]|nr:ABC transporter ATP-binding protein [Alphaproteobacteria bacterium]MCL2505366.1 ABC transporter ATP-binding protein [Alphaproteobacteria bacterium]